MRKPVCTFAAIVSQVTGAGYGVKKLQVGFCVRWAFTLSGGRPRPRGGPCLRFRQRDEGVPRGPGGPPHAVQGDRPTRSRGTAPPRRCQSDYLSQADSQFSQIVWPLVQVAPNREVGLSARRESTQKCSVRRSSVGRE